MSAAFRPEALARGPMGGAASERARIDWPTGSLARLAFGLGSTLGQGAAARQ